MPRPATDIAGARFGRLIAVSRFFGDSRHLAAKWNCLCDCGATVIARADVLKTGGVRSCGCLALEVASELGRRQGRLNATHGHTTSNKETGEYSTWMGMKARCFNPKNIHFENYGGRGITVCESWLEFQNFLKDMGPRPEFHTIDRIDPDGNYEPGNCRWATVTQQNRNRRDNRILSQMGSSLTLAEWSEKTGIPSRTISVRIDKLGWSVERALSEPPRRFKRR